MPMDFLARIEDATFPLAVHDEGEIQCAAVLAAANLIEANLPEPGQGGQARCLILRITPMGRAELNRMRRERP